MGRIFASSDWHGTGYLADKIFNFLKPDDTLYFLGDATDRNPDGIKIFKALMTRPNTFYIKGNHDELLEYAIEKDLWDSDLKYIPHLPKYNIQEFDINHWAVVNGGGKTYEALLQETEEEQKKMLKYIQDMPLTITLTTKQGNIILEHAGYTPGITSMQKHDPLWDRAHFSHEWVASENIYIVHGHTPVQYLKYDIGYNGEEPLTKEEMLHRKHFFANEPTDYKPTILRYCHGHKFDLDMCTIYSDRVALLDLDTFEEYYFNGKDE